MVQPAAFDTATESVTVTATAGGASGNVLYTCPNFHDATVEFLHISNGAASTAGRSWYGTDAKLAGGARGGGVYLSSFATQQAYETWARSKRLEAKKAAEQEKKPNAANYVQYTAGTG